MKTPKNQNFANSIFLSLIELKGFAFKKDLATFIDCSPTTITSAIARNSIGRGLKKLLIDKFPEVRPEFIRTGELPMLKEDEAFTYNHKGKGQPYYSVDFLGGFGVVENTNTVQPDGYINLPKISKVDMWVDISGKSMSPFISHGDIVALKQLPNWKEYIQFGEIYGIVTEHFRTVRLVTKSTLKDHWLLKPYNKNSEFVDQDIPIELIKHVFIVKACIKKFF